MNRFKKIIRKIWPFYLQRRLGPEKVLEYMAPFVRAGYNQAIFDVGAWLYKEYKDVKFIPYAELADFLLKEMNEKKEITCDAVLKEITVKKKAK